MKNRLTPLLFLMILPFCSQGQDKTCCKPGSQELFGQLALQSDFAAGHEAPLPFEYSAEVGKMITYACVDSTEASAFEIKAEKATNNWVVIIHEWWGLNDYIKQEAELLQKDLGNVNIIAIDLYDGKIAETPAMAQQLLGGLKEERARMIIEGALKLTGSKSKILTMGWCMGGGWAMQTSLMAGQKSSGCVMYYGMPETDVKQLKKLSGDVLGIFASKDEWINKDVVTQFQTDMKAAGKNLTVKTFTADHAFANPSNPKYDKVAAGEARKLAIEFLKKRLAGAK